MSAKFQKCHVQSRMISIRQFEKFFQKNVCKIVEIVYFAAFFLLWYMGWIGVPFRTDEINSIVPSTIDLLCQGGQTEPSVRTDYSALAARCCSVRIGQAISWNQQNLEWGENKVEFMWKLHELAFRVPKFCVCVARPPQSGVHYVTLHAYLKHTHTGCAVKVHCWTLLRYIC